MISLLITLGAVAEHKALFGPDYGYELPVSAPERTDPSDSKDWRLPKLRFDDSQDCLTFLEKKMEGFGTLRISQSCADGGDDAAPWRSL